MESLLAICWEFDHQEEWETWAQLEGLLGCPYRLDLWMLILLLLYNKLSQKNKASANKEQNEFNLEADDKLESKTKN